MAVDDCSCDYSWVAWVDTSDGNGLAFEINISIAITGVYAQLNFDNVSVTRRVDCSLDIIEISRPV
ncbi:unnamed protein product, partial [marine sediment metagenome]